MSEVVAAFLLLVAVVAAAVVWIPKFETPLSFDVGMSLCALALIPIADAIRVDRAVGAWPPIMGLVGLGLILLSYRRERVTRNSGEPHVIDDRDLRKVSGGRKS